MRPPLPVLLPLLLATFFAIAHAETNTAAVPSPSLATYPTPAWTPVSPPPPSPPKWSPVSPPPPPPPAWTPVSSPPPPPPASTPVSPPPPPPPAWTPVADVNVQSIKQVRQFAVRIHALHREIDLVFVKVVSCRTQPSKDGYIYQLVVAVTGSGAESPQYNAVVWGILGTMRWELRSFKPK